MSDDEDPRSFETVGRRLEEIYMKIAAFAADGEGPRAHFLEDELMRQALVAIAANTDRWTADQIERIALGAVSTKDMDFDRWYE